MSATHLFLLSALCLVGGVVLLIVRESDAAGIMLVGVGSSGITGGYVHKSRGEAKVKKAYEAEAETTATLRAELFEATRGR